jgi:dTMP kinase
VKRHMFVVLEGGDGSGKTSIRKHLFQRLVESGAEALTLIQTSWLVPEHTEVITNARFHQRAYPQHEITAAYVGDKEATTRSFVEPHLPYRHLIGDRYVGSDMVYHRLLWGIPSDTTYEAYAASGVRFPDLTVFVDTDPETAYERLQTRGGDRRNRWDTLEAQKTLYTAFNDILFSGRYPRLGPVVRIDNRGRPEDTRAIVDRDVLPLVQLREEPGGD